MNIVILAHTRIGSDFVVGSHHLYRCFKKSGHNVIHISSPISLLHIFNLHKKEIRERFKIALKQLFNRNPIDNNYIPINTIPVTNISNKLPRVVRRILSYPLGLRPTVARELSNAQIDLLIIDHPAWAGVDSVISATKTIYRPTDIYTDFNPSIRAAEEELLELADVIITTSLPTKLHIENYRKNKEVHVIRNGVDLTAWETLKTEPSDIERIPHPRAIYVGALDIRFDFNLIEEAAKLEHSTSFILIGPLNKSQPQSSLPNVHYLGSRPHAKIPAYIEYCDVALITTNDHPANEGRSPMKIYEYAASGLGVIARTTAELSSRKDEGFLFLYKDIFNFREALTFALNNKRSIRKNALASVKSMSWSNIAENIIKISSALNKQ